MQEQEKKEQGFTLIELLIAIVVVGILTAVAIVGIAGLTNKGNSSACSATLDAAKAASAVYYANSGGKAYPNTFTELTAPGSGPALLTVPTSVTNTGSELSANGWTIVISGDALSDPVFTTTGCGGGSGA